MLTWITEITRPAYNSVGIQLWSCEEYALVAACAILMVRVKDDWDRSDSDCQAHALKVSDACSACNWREAIRLFNEWEGDGDFDTMQHVRVYSKPESTSLPPVYLLRGSHITVGPPPPPAPPAPFKAMYPGAVCRGPCKQVSTDAYADKSDGTYCCYQCKYMSAAFGRPIP